METSKVALVLALALLGIASGFARDKTAEIYGEVGDQIQQRTGRTLRWEKDDLVREQNLQEARQLLRRPLTIQTAVQIALLNNRALQGSLEEVGIAFADFREAGFLQNPTMGVNPQILANTPRTVEWDYTITLDLLDGLFIPLRKQLSREQLEAAKLRVADQVVQLIAEVKSGYYEVVADQQILDRLSTIEKGFDASLTLAQKQFEAGNSTDVALGLEQVNYSQIRLEIAQTRANLLEAHEKLNRLLGVWGLDTEWKTQNTLPPVPDSDLPAHGLETLAISRRYDLAAAQHELRSTVQAVGMAKTYRFVSALEVGAGGTRNTNATNQVGPSLSVQLPIFNQGQARIARGEARLRQAERHFEDLAIEIRSEVRLLRDRLASRRETAKFYETDILPVRRQVLGGQFLQYNAMIVGPFDLFRTKIDELQAEQNYIQALKEYWKTRAELERAVGGALTPVNQSGSKQVIFSDSK
jgi:cobalt-zinc-cadmium efflux system outer membrane protein